MRSVAEDLLDITLLILVKTNSIPSHLPRTAKKNTEKEIFKAAAGLFSQAAQAYASVQDELNAAEMKNNESVAFLQAGNAKEALQATDGTEEVFQKAGDLKRQGIAVSNRAAALEGMKKWQDALAEYDRAASLVRTGRRRRHAFHCAQSRGKYQSETRGASPTHRWMCYDSCAWWKNPR